MDAVMARLKSLPSPITIRGERLVVHHQSDPAAIGEMVECIAQMAKEVRQGKGKKVNAEILPEKERAVAERELKVKAGLGY